MRLTYPAGESIAEGSRGRELGSSKQAAQKGGATKSQVGSAKPAHGAAKPGTQPAVKAAANPSAKAAGATPAASPAGRPSAVKSSSPPVTTDALTLDNKLKNAHETYNAAKARMNQLEAVKAQHTRITAKLKAARAAKKNAEATLKKASQQISALSKTKADLVASAGKDPQQRQVRSCHRSIICTVVLIFLYWSICMPHRLKWLTMARVCTGGEGGRGSKGGTKAGTGNAEGGSCH